MPDLRKALSLTFLVTLHVQAQQSQSFEVSYTEFGQPDLQGVWVAASLTPLERPPGLPGLVIPEERVEQFAAAIQQRFPDVIDPDISLHGIDKPIFVNGEYRSSLVIYPEDGLIPYSETGLEWVAWNNHRNLTLFDHPEQRPQEERCLSGIGFPPMRSFIVEIPNQIVQTQSHVLIYTEDSGGARIIRLDGEPGTNDSARGQGYSFGHWEDDTLVVETAGFRGDDPARFGLGRALLIGTNSVVTERFRRIGDDEILYRFTVEDPDFYTEPWSGEFSFHAYDYNVYEYGCHEGNYSMRAILLGGQMEQARLAEEASTQ